MGDKTVIVNPQRDKDALEGKSPSGNAVSGLSTSGTGVFGKSTTGRGVWGQSEFIATVGDSTNGTGVWGRSINGVGVHGVGPTAAQFDGDVQISPLGDKKGSLSCYDVNVGGQDCAEYFDVSSGEVIEPGMIMVLDEDGALKVCELAYDRRVAGAVSGAGPYKPGIVLGNRPFQENRYPIALVGKVYCKVDAEFEPISVGDLLTTSTTPGHAMKASDPHQAFGAVMGKAMRSLNGGRGLIPVLIALQ